MRFVVDASAAVELLLRTPLGTKVVHVLAGASLYAPELLDAEVLAVLRRAWLAGRISETRALEAIDDLAAWNVKRVAHRPLLRQAWRYRNNATGYDALYLATAATVGASLVTADGPLSRMPPGGVVVQNIR